jgi:uncharacterized protein
VDPAHLLDRVPAGTTLDSWNGQCLVSVVGFQFEETRVLGVPVPFHQSFEEVNLRFYVRRVTNDDVRLGVVFIRELVPRLIMGGMARLLYKEPYSIVPMRSKVKSGSPPDVEYQWHSTGRWQTVAGAGSGEGAQPEPGSLEEFLTVRHWGYNGGRGKDTLEYRVDHPRWRVWPARNVRVDYTAEAFELQSPMSALIADGSAVTVYWRNQITG